jgi:hypothetical protein
MTLGCGGFGGNITSDNISPRHLLNIKRVAYEVAPVVSRWDRAGSGYPMAAQAAALPSATVRPPAPAGISAEALSRRIDEFLGSRGFKPVDGAQGTARSDDGQAGVRHPSDPAGPRPGLGHASDPTSKPLDFVCEDDVRRAIQAGQQLVVSERAIVTPAARDLGEQHRIFSTAPWRG